MTAETAPRPIRLGIIGTGLAVEQLHWPALKQLPEHFHIVAFANDGRPNAEHFAAYSGIALDDYTADYHDLLRRDDVEAVLISLPIPLNYPVTRDALMAGKHVICEKPAGVDEAEARQFLTLAEQVPPASHPDCRELLLPRRPAAGAVAARRRRARAAALYVLAQRQPAGAGAWPLLQHALAAAPRLPGRRAPRRRGPPYRANPAALRRRAAGRGRNPGRERHARRALRPDAEPTLRQRCGRQLHGALPRTARAAGAERTATVRHRGGDGGGDRRLRSTGRSARRKRTPSMADGGYYNELRNFYDAVVHGEPIVGTIAPSTNLLMMMRGLDAAETGAP